MAAPSSPASGWAYYDSTALRLKSYDGSAWKQYVALNDSPTFGTVTTTSTASFGARVTVTHTNYAALALNQSGGNNVYLGAGTGTTPSCYISNTAAGIIVEFRNDKTTIFSGSTIATSFGYVTYNNTGAVTTVDWSVAGMQYATVSAATNIAFSNGVANQFYTLIIKSSSGGPWVVTFTSMGTANVGTQWSIPASASGAAAFLFIFTASRWFLLGTDSATPNTNSYTFP
jgi:hypothetical protein